MRIAINGAGIAGPTLAFWLRKSDHKVLLIEESPQLRRGGYAIDFWGIGFDVAERMGLLPRIRELGFIAREMRYVNRHGHVSGGFPVDVLSRLTKGRFTEVRRSDLAAVIYDALDEGVEVIFGDSVKRIRDEGSFVRVDFEHAATREVDLVIGADGLHSRVRQLVFGPKSDFEFSLGYQVAAFEVENYRSRDQLVAVSYAVSGRQVTRLSMGSDATLFLFVFRDEYLAAEHWPSNNQERESALREVFAGIGWECPRILAAMEDASSIYFDRISQIRMDRWTNGRTALVGDAAACVSLLAGEGAGLAMAEAYVLAGELLDCGGDFRTAFARYQDRLMPLLKRKQESAAKFASSFAPKSTSGIIFRNQVSRLLRLPFFAKLILGLSVRDEISLPDYRF